MKKTRMDQLQERLQAKLDPDRGGAAAQAMEREYKRLCAGDEKQPEAFLTHLHNNIYPVAAAYRALMEVGMAQAEASDLVQSTFLELMEDTAASIRKLCRLPGFYRLVPGLFGRLMPRLFQKEAGFAFTFLPAERHRVRFNMEACPYLQACRTLGCPELAPVFCATDDICYGHMHPRLLWNRTQTLARGGDCCDFDLRADTGKRKNR